MKINRKRQFVLQGFGLILILLLLSNLPQLDAAQVTEPRKDGLTIIQSPTSKDQAGPVCYLTMMIKTGYADDPKDKAGLTDLTNELFYYLLRTGAARDIQYDTAAEFSLFNFTVSRKNYDGFCAELDFLFRRDALLLYDLCNELIRYHLNEPHPEQLIAGANYRELIYGASHPYLTIDHPTYRNLTIADANNWFRQIYRPNNVIMATSSKLPADFLLRPFGREIQQPVKFPPIQPAPLVPAPELKLVTIHDNLSTMVIGFSAPKIDESGCFPVMLIQKYLQQELWDQVREQSGLCYDLQVSYSYLTEPTAPTLTICCQTLPEDSKLTLQKILAVLKKLAAEGIPDSQKIQLLEREKQQLLFRNNSLSTVIQRQALQAYFNQSWLGNVDSVSDNLAQVSQEQVKQEIARGLKQLKISIAGPREVSEAFKDAHLETELLPEMKVEKAN